MAEMMQPSIALAGVMLPSFASPLLSQADGATLCPPVLVTPMAQDDVALFHPAPRLCTFAELTSIRLSAGVSLVTAGSFLRSCGGATS